MGWTWKDDAFKGVAEDQVEDVMAQREPVVKTLAEQISSLRTEREQRGFRRQWEAEEGYEPDFEDDNEAATHGLRLEMERALEDAQEAALLEQLDKLGARMMRPYEHWNEDEKLMEYLERDRD